MTHKRKRGLLAEPAARAILEALVPRMDARYVGEQSRGEHDFDLYCDGERIGVMEVTASANRAVKADIAAIDQKSAGGSKVPRPEVNHGWNIHPMAGASIRTIRRDVGTYLAAVETEGRQSFSIQDIFRSAAVRRIVEDLRIYSGDRFFTKGDIGLVILWHPSGQMIEVKAENVLSAVRTEMEKGDNRRKLRNALDLAERHLFIVIDVDHYGPWVALNDCSPPETEADLIDEITHLWVATITRARGEWVVWSAVRGSRWQRTWLRNEATILAIDDA
jgi:hypothetical protein